MSALLDLPTCTGRVGATGMCLGGHLAFRCALDARVAAAVCYFATDMHSRTLGARVAGEGGGGGDDSLERAGEIRGEVVMVRVLVSNSFILSYRSNLILSYHSLLSTVTNERTNERMNEPSFSSSFSFPPLIPPSTQQLTNPPTQIFGKSDPHVPPQGRDLIRATLHDAAVCFSFYEIAHAQHAFISDEASKGRYDPAVAGVCLGMLEEVFGRVLRAGLGPRDDDDDDDGGKGKGELVC